MRHVQRQLFFLFFVTALLTGCVSIDNRIEHEAVDRDATANLSGVFSNHASYRSSTGNFVVKSSFAEVLGEGLVAAVNADTVRVSLREDHLKLEFLKGETVVASRTHKRQELSIGVDGKIELPTDRAFGGDAALIGYQTRTVTLFVNPQGDLVAVHSGGGAGTLAIVIPIGVYAKHMAIFPRQR